MIIRHTYLERRRTLGNSGTLTEKIDVKKSITAFDVIFRAKNGGTENRNNRLIHCIKKFELLDGGKTYLSLTGPQLQAMHFYEYKKAPYQYLVEQPDLYQQAGFRIPFGRFMGDPLYGLDPRRLENPQYNIEWDLEETRDVGATAFLTGTMVVSIIAHVVHEPNIVPEGIMMMKEVERWTSSGSGDYTTDMPYDYPWRRLMIRAHKDNTLVEDNLTNIELSVEQRDIVPFDIRTDDFYRIMHAKYGECKFMQQFYARQGDTIKHDLATEVVIVPAGELTNAFVNIISPSGGSAQIQIYDAANAVVAADQIVWANMMGLNFHHTIAMDFGDPIDPNSWFPANKFKDLQLINTQGAADVAFSIILQQARKYGR